MKTKGFARSLNPTVESTPHEPVQSPGFEEGRRDTALISYSGRLEVLEEDGGVEMALITVRKTACLKQGRPDEDPAHRGTLTTTPAIAQGREPS